MIRDEVNLGKLTLWLLAIPYMAGFEWAQLQVEVPFCSHLAQRSTFAAGPRTPLVKSGINIWGGMTKGTQQQKACSSCYRIFPIFLPY